MTLEYATAYSEVLLILEHMDKKYQDKIPSRLLDYFRNSCDSNYQNTIDFNLPLKQNKLNKYTLPLLAMLLINYWCETPEEKQELVNHYFENEIRFEEELKQKFNPDLLFKK